MTSKQRILAVWNGLAPDHVPLTTWCFGLSAPPSQQWEKDGVAREYWYSLRMEHIHTLPQPWDLDDDFKRVLAWRSLGLDDILDVSVPWSTDAAVSWKDSTAPPATMDPRYPVAVRQYETPAGPLRHAVRLTGEDQGKGWVVQPDRVPLFEDYNVPRAAEHAVSKAADVLAIRYLYRPPDQEARSWFAARMEKIGAFAEREAVPVQAWSAFGMDALVWLAGFEGAIMLALDAPVAFGELLNIITETDLARTELAVSSPAVDMIVMRGWYSSTDLWSPALFDQFVYPHVQAVAELVHNHGKKLAYTMTTGVEALGPRLADAGVDVLYFVDPAQDGITPERAKDLLADRLTLAGGINSVSLESDTPEMIREHVRHALDVLGPTNRFILHPVDAIFPNTPWSGVEAMMEAWASYC